MAHERLSVGASGDHLGGWRGVGVGSEHLRMASVLAWTATGTLEVRGCQGDLRGIGPRGAPGVGAARRGARESGLGVYGVRRRASRSPRSPPRPRRYPTRGPAAPRALTSCSSMSAPRLERTKPRSGRSEETEAPAPWAGLLVRVLTLDGNSAIAAPLASRGRSGRRRRPCRGGCRLPRRSSRGAAAPAAAPGAPRGVQGGSLELPGAAGTPAPPSLCDPPF